MRGISGWSTDSICFASSFVCICQGLEHVGYLSSEQALADFVSLIDHIKSTVPGATRSPVVAFGGSYGGMLAAWLRMKYPHSVVGSVLC